MAILVYGDVMLDEWRIGSVDRISPEAPVPVLLESGYKRNVGGAGNLAVNLASINGEVDLYGPLGKDKQGYGFLDLLKDTKVNSYLSSCMEATTSKVRIVSTQGQQICRFDTDAICECTEAEDRFINSVNKNDLVVISDYNKGTIQDPQRLIKILKQNSCYIIVDPKQHLDLYTGADVIKPNKKEYEEYNNGVDTDMVVTLGADGYMINGTHYPTQQQEVYDVTGAGDTFLAVMSYFLDFGESLEFACEMANKGAGVSVQHNGVYVVHWKDLDPRPTVVFTNGCFDLLHRGHVEMLRASKALGEHLVVGLNTDASVKRLKGDTRPINNETDRKVVLESLDFVDEVILFDEDTPQQLIERIRPDIITKGGDYTIDTVVGNELAKVVIIPTVENQSTTNTIKRIVL